MRVSRNNQNVMRDVLTFLLGHGRREAWLVTGVACSMIVATIADLFMPVFAGRMVDAIAMHTTTHQQALRAALSALGTILLMARLASDAFCRVQRFSTDWHANNFAGSIVRRVTRGMWAVDLMDDTLLLALLPASLVLVGSALVLGAHWLSMGLIVAIGATLYVGLSIALSLNFVSPAARLSNAQDTLVGGSLADAVTCKPVVKFFRT